MTIRLKYFFLLTALSLGALLPHLSAQIENPKAVFRDLTRLDGVWFMPTDRGDRLEIWNWVDDSTMVGRGCRIKIETGDTVTLENLRLLRRDTNIIYYAKVRGQNDAREIPFQLTKEDGETYIFENPKHGDPAKITYVLLEKRELQVTTEGTRNGRPTKQEYVFEREFNPASVEFRIRAGVNASQLYKFNEIGTIPDFAARPGWELGIGAVFKGRGGLISFNTELGVVGKLHRSKSEFTIPVDTLPFTATYKRDLTYNQTWLSLGLMPEVRFKRNGKASFVFGGYFSRLLINRVIGTEEPIRNKKVFNFNNDFKKIDYGAILGLNFRQNFGKKDTEGMFGLRAQFGLANIDNLYVKIKETGGFYNGRLGITSITLLYSVNLLKL